MALTVAPRPPHSIVALVVVALALLAAFAAAILVLGALRRPAPPENGPLIVANGGQIRAVDVTEGTSRVIATLSHGGEHVTRSPDGRLVAFWRPGAAGDQLMTIGIEDQAQHGLVEGQTLRWAGCADTWSPDSRYLATEVTIGGTSRILIADTVTGDGRLLTGEGVVAPAPCGRPTAIGSPSRTARHAGTDLGRVRDRWIRQASGQRRSGWLPGRRTGSWSPDGAWIYFAADRSDPVEDA